jgi:hypothetical protein
MDEVKGFRGSDSDDPEIPSTPAAPTIHSGLTLLNTKTSVHSPVSRYARQSRSAAGSRVVAVRLLQFVFGILERGACRT